MTKTKLFKLFFALLLLVSAILVPQLPQLGQTGEANADAPPGWYDPNFLYCKSKLLTASDGEHLDFTVTGGAVPLKLHSGDAETITVQPSTEDSYIRQYAPNTNYGTEANLYLYDASAASNVYRSLLELSTASVPSGATVTSAIMSIYLYGYYLTIDAAKEIQCKRITAAWDESTVTWTNQPAVTDTDQATATTVHATTGWVNFNVLALVQDAIANRSNVLSVRLSFTTESGASSLPAFYSSEYTTNLTLRPKLVVTYETTGCSDDADDLYFNGKCKDYFDDIRVTESDGTTLIPYYLRNVTASYAELCILTDVTDAAKDVWIYYGNPLAGRASNVYATFLTAEEYPRTTIYTGSGNQDYNNSGNMIRLHDGTLLATWRSASQHIQDTTYSKLVYSLSLDQGRTWSAPATLQDTANEDDADVGLLEFDNDGTWTVLVRYCVWGIGSYTKKTTTSSLLAGSPSWSSSVSVGAFDSFQNPTEMSHIKSGESKKRIIISCHLSFVVHIYYSVDGGDSWTDVTVGSRSGYNLCEPGILEIKDGGIYDGDLYILARNNASPYGLSKATSPDYGGTWSSFSDSGLTSNAAEKGALLRGSDGTAITAYCPLAGDYNGEGRLVKASSEDEDITWDTSNYAIYWRSRNSSMYGGDYAYASPVNITGDADSQIGVLYHEGTGGTAASMRFAWVELERFIGAAQFSNTTAKLTAFDDYFLLQEAVADNSVAVKQFNPTATKYVFEAKFKTTSQSTNDQQIILGYDSGANKSLFWNYFPSNIEQTKAKYKETASIFDLYTSFNESGTVVYIHQITVDEDAGKVSHYLYDSSWSLLASATNKDYAESGASALTLLTIGSGTASGQAYSQWYYFTVRQYAAAEPQWSTTGEEIHQPTDISNLPTSHNFGAVAPSSIYWASGAEPSWPLASGDCWGNLTNNSSFAIDIDAYAGNMTGGNTYTLVSGVPATDEFRMTLFKSGESDGAKQDYTTYMDEGNSTPPTSSHYSVASSTITYTGLTTSESVWVYKDFGADYFDENFHFYVDGYMSSSSDVDSRVILWAVTNDLGDVYSLSNASKSFLYIHMYNDSGTNTIELNEEDSGSGESDYYVGSLDTAYYLDIYRDESVGTYGNLTCVIYDSSAERATQTGAIDTLSIALRTSKKDYRYLYGLSSYNAGDIPDCTGWIANLIVFPTLDIEGLILTWSPQVWISSLTAGNSTLWDLKFETWSSNSDGHLKTCIITFEASAS